ncbi:MAG: enoyl-[acyl-carrier-protein] reductase FabK [Clostridium sp.]
MFQNKFTQMLGINYPIIQGGMAWIADAKLAASVSNAGGLGLITGFASIDWLRDEIKKAKALTDKPFGVNIMLMHPEVDEVARLVCTEGVKVITTGAGTPSKYMDMWKSHGIKVIAVVPSVALAKRLERAGVDAIIAEGCEAGGHIGQLTTMALVPQVVDAVSIPVVAAGGIGDGRGVAASFMLGALAVQVGTRFLVANECFVHENYKDKVISAKDIDTDVTGRDTGHPVRVIRNKLSRRFLQLEKERAGKEEYDAIGTGAYKKAIFDGDVEYGSVMAGQISGLINKKQSSFEIIEEMFSEAEILLKKGIGVFNG